MQQMDNPGGENQYGDHETQEALTFDRVQGMPYLQMVVKEGLRMHPATGLPMWRDVPEGSTLGLNAWIAHRNTSIFGQDAARFQPERWDPEVTPKSELARMEGYYIPFGAGTRTCIGKNISIMEICKLIPMLVQRYDFEIVPSPPSKPGKGGSQLVTNNLWFVKPMNVSVRVRRARKTFGDAKPS
ncbi:hypothetical protein LTR84_012329 [Exophiala bonariae]|uniref:Uncharacterized protein n=1 Tax=Exophiala bonariae TaxID=1690606 RepID=A0AAV9NH83_9EURO|nr:hypothetical protein LTR84_012329 [Exophiala bonariae]